MAPWFATLLLALPPASAAALEARKTHSIRPTTSTTTTTTTSATPTISPIPNPKAFVRFYAQRNNDECNENRSPDSVTGLQPGRCYNVDGTRAFKAKASISGPIGIDNTGKPLADFCKVTFYPVQNLTSTRPVAPCRNRALAHNLYFTRHKAYVLRANGQKTWCLFFPRRNDSFRPMLAPPALEIM